MQGVQEALEQLSKTCEGAAVVRRGEVESVGTIARDDATWVASTLGPSPYAQFELAVNDRVSRVDAYEVGDGAVLVVANARESDVDRIVAALRRTLRGPNVASASKKPALETRRTG